MVDVVYGDSNAPGLPPVNLPTLGQGQPQAPTRIVISGPAGAQTTVNGGWAPFNAQNPVEAQVAPQPGMQQGAQPQQDQSGGWAPFQPNETPPPEISSGEAALRGAAHGLTFGFYPAIAGAAAGAKAALTGEGDFSTAYDQTRQQEQQAQDEAQKQHPYISTAADIAANVPWLLVPGVGAGRAAMATAEALPRIGQAALSGAVAGGLFGAGEQTSKGGSALDVAEGLGGGALAGAALGGVFGSAVEGGVGVGRKVASLVRGKRDHDLEAQRLVLGEYGKDIRQVLENTSDPAQAQARREAGIDMRVVDYGGRASKRLLRTAVNLSPEAANTVDAVVPPRFQQQGNRVGRFIKGFVGGVPRATEPLRSRLSSAFRQSVGLNRSSAEDILALREAARRANRPAYTRAYEAGDRQIWSKELEQLSSAPSIQQALRYAVSKWRDWQVHDGFGAANPPVMVKNGILDLGNGRGLPVFPNIQFWDYAARHVADRAEEARRAGKMQEATLLGGLERQLKAQLDKIVPEYGQARAGAARFFGAEDAYDAGRAFAASRSADIGASRQAMKAMSEAERELFARGYAAELADILDRPGDAADLLKSSFLSSPAARQKNLLALGQDRAARIEGLLDRARIFAAFGNAENASEAGRYFVDAPRGKIENRQASVLLSRMTKDERAQFSDAFAQELADRLESIGDNRSILNSIFVNNGPAKQRILLALGEEKAARLESVLRVEGIIDRTRTALGNSTTLQQSADASKATKMLATWEGIRAVAGNLNPAYLIVAPLLWGARQTAKDIDERVFARVAEMLLSEDPAVLARGLDIAAKNPTVRTALRYASDLSARELVNLLGPSGVAAAALTIGKHMPGKEAPKEHPQDYYDNQGQQVAPP